MNSSDAETRPDWGSRTHKAAVIVLWLAVLSGAAIGCAKDTHVVYSTTGAEISCSEAWYRSIEERVPTGDGRGHGPDIGSEEWKSVAEFKLGVRGKRDVPGRDSELWCQHINHLVSSKCNNTADGTPCQELRKTQPAFACDEVVAGSVEEMICADEVLSLLDRKLADVYAAAWRKAENHHPPVHRAEQRGWIKGRNECWKADDQRQCVKNVYERRIAELQARYGLVPHKGPIHFTCDGNPAKEVVATFFSTDPPTLIAEHGDSISLMYLQPSGSGSRYGGRNASLWEHQGRALITWGYGAPEMQCVKAP